jgi:hypothetical protein
MAESGERLRVPTPTERRKSSDGHRGLVDRQALVLLQQPTQPAQEVAGAARRILLRDERRQRQRFADGGISLDYQPRQDWRDRKMPCPLLVVQVRPLIRDVQVNAAKRHLDPYASRRYAGTFRFEL